MKNGYRTSPTAKSIMNNFQFSTMRLCAGPVSERITSEGGANCFWSRLGAALFLYAKRFRCSHATAPEGNRHTRARHNFSCGSEGLRIIQPSGCGVYEAVAPGGVLANQPTFR
jgi:hypothetical protein